MVIGWGLTAACGFVVCLLVSVGLGSAAAMLAAAPPATLSPAAPARTAAVAVTTDVNAEPDVAAEPGVAPNPNVDAEPAPTGAAVPPEGQAVSTEQTVPPAARPQRRAAPATAREAAPRAEAIAQSAAAPTPVIAEEVAFLVRAGPKARGVAVSVDGRAVGVIPLSTRVQPGARSVRFYNGNAKLNLTCTIEVGESGRTIEFDARRATCP